MADFQADYQADCYTFTHDKTTIEFDRVSSGRNGEIKTECKVRWNERPNDGVIHRGSLNVLAAQTVKSFAKACADRVPEFDWQEAFVDITGRTIDRYRAGDPPILLSDVDPAERPRWLVRPILAHGNPTIIAAAGGSGKSFLALAALATACTGRGKFLGLNATGKAVPGIYIDYEADEHTHQNRLEALCKGSGVDYPTNLFYRRERVPMHQASQELARFVAKNNIGAAVVDSKGAGMGGAPEDAEKVLEFFTAVARLQVPVLIVDHITNEMADNPGRKQRPYGSVYTQNQARQIWMAQTVEGEDDITTVWTLTKNNNGKKGAKLAWRLVFDKRSDDTYESIVCTQVSAQSVQAMEPKDMSLRERLRVALTVSEHPLTTAELCEKLGEPSNKLRAVLNRCYEFVNVGSSSGGIWRMGGDDQIAPSVAP